MSTQVAVQLRQLILKEKVLAINFESNKCNIPDLTESEIYHLLLTKVQKYIVTFLIFLMGLSIKPMLQNRLDIVSCARLYFTEEHCWQDTGTMKQKIRWLVPIS